MKAYTDIQASLPDVQRWNPTSKDLQDLCGLSSREYEKRRLTGSLGNWTQVDLTTPSLPDKRGHMINTQA